MKSRQSSAYRLLEVLRDEWICPMVDRIPGTLSGQCIGQQIMLDTMDALFQLSQALLSPKGEKRLRHVNIALIRLEDLQSNVAAMRARTKRFDKIAAEKKKNKPARVVTEKQYSDFLSRMNEIYPQLDLMQLKNEQYAASQLKSQTGESPE